MCGKCGIGKGIEINRVAAVIGMSDNVNQGILTAFNISICIFRFCSRVNTWAMHTGDGDIHPFQ